MWHRLHSGVCGAAVPRDALRPSRGLRGILGVHQPDRHAQVVWQGACAVAPQSAHPGQAQGQGGCAPDECLFFLPYTPLNCSATRSLLCIHGHFGNFPCLQCVVMRAFKGISSAPHDIPANLTKECLTWCAQGIGGTPSGGRRTP